MDEIPPLIQANKLSKYFGDTCALNEISFQINAGELFGFVGPDGAGKTTTLRLCAGILDISSGSLIVDGIDMDKSAETLKPRIGYMAQQFSLYRELSVQENLQFFAQIFNVSKQQYTQRSDYLLDFAGLSEFKDRRASKLSGGMQKKLALACTLIHEPKILLMDEPTTGVDPISRREFWEILTNLHIQGTTILVSTPYMDEADRCSQVGLMYQGQMLLQETPKKIRDLLPGDVIEIVPDDRLAAEDVLEQIPGVIEIQNYGERLHVIVDSGSQRIKKIKKSFRKNGLAIKDINITSPKMEEAFIHLIRDKVNQSSSSDPGAEEKSGN